MKKRALITAIRRRIHATGQAGGRIGVGEGVDAVDEHSGGTSESDAGGLFVGGDLLVRGVVTEVGCQPFEHPIGVLPVGTVIEVDEA